MNLTELTKEIINGRRLTRDDDLSFFETADLTELAAGGNPTGIMWKFCRFMHDHQRPCRKMLGKL